MSDQRVTPSQRDLITRAFQSMLDREGMNPAGIFREFQAWCDRNNKDCDVSHETVRKWCILAKGEGHTLARDPQKGGQLVGFTQEREQRLHPDDNEGMLVRAATQLFAWSSNPPTERLRRLHGRHLMIRRRWRRPAEHAEFMQCIVDFEVNSDRAIFRETQKMGSTASRATDQIDENYTGYAFMFGAHFFVIAHEKNRTTVKFLTVHSCEPSLLHGNSPVITCRGNLIAVCDPGPNESHRFVLVRTNTRAKCEYLRKSQLNNIMDKEEIDYLCFNDAEA